MRTPWEVETLDTSLRPIFYVSRILGITPFSLGIITVGLKSVYSKKWGIILKSWELFQTLVVIVALISCALISTYIRLNHENIVFMVIASDVAKLAVFAVTSVTSLAFCGIFNGKKMKSILNKIIYVDKMLLTNPSWSYRKMYVVFCMEVILLYTSMFILFFYDGWVWTHGIRNHSFQYYMTTYPFHLVNITMSLQFVNFVLILRNRFWHLNQQLRLILKTIKIRSLSPQRIHFCEQEPWFLNIHQTSATPYQNISSRICDLRRLYDKLCDVGMLINSCYGLPLLFDVAGNFIDFTSIIYFILIVVLGYQQVTDNATGLVVSTSVNY